MSYLFPSFLGIVHLVGSKNSVHFISRQQP